MAFTIATCFHLLFIELIKIFVTIGNWLKFIASAWLFKTRRSECGKQELNRLNFHKSLAHVPSNIHDWTFISVFIAYASGSKPNSFDAITIILFISNKDCFFQSQLLCGYDEIIFRSWHEIDGNIISFWIPMIGHLVMEMFIFSTHLIFKFKCDIKVMAWKPKDISMIDPASFNFFVESNDSHLLNGPFALHSPRMPQCNEYFMGADRNVKRKLLRKLYSCAITVQYISSSDSTLVQHLQALWAGFGHFVASFNESAIRTIFPL